jgi:hypothetical protein
VRIKSKEYVHTKNFISNLDKRDKRALVEASKRSSIKIYFEDKAYDANGLLLKDTIGVFSNDMEQDHSDLWCEYNYLNYMARKGRIREVVSV